MFTCEEENDATDQENVLVRVERVVSVKHLLSVYNSEIDRAMDLIRLSTSSKVKGFYWQHISDLRLYRTLLLMKHEKLLNERNIRILSLCELLEAYNRVIAKAKIMIMMETRPKLEKLCRLHLEVAESNRSIYLEYLKKI